MIRDMKIGDIVLENTLAAEVFDHYGLDYCCHGNIKLTDACRIKFIDITKVIHDLNETRKGDSLKEIAEGDINTLIHYIITKHHRYVKHMAPLILQYLKECTDTYASQYPLFVKVRKVFSKITSDLETHTRKEEEMLFPNIIALDRKQTSNISGNNVQTILLRDIVEILQYEHEIAGNEMLKIHELLNGFTLPVDAPPIIKTTYSALEEFENDLHYHVLLENFVLFARAEKLVSDIANL